MLLKTKILCKYIVFLYLISQSGSFYLSYFSRQGRNPYKLLSLTRQTYADCFLIYTCKFRGYQGNSGQPDSVLKKVYKPFFFYKHFIFTCISVMWLMLLLYDNIFISEIELGLGMKTLVKGDFICCSNVSTFLFYLKQ